MEPIRYDGACAVPDPDGERRCILQAGHHGNHGSAEDGTADWWVRTPAGQWPHRFASGEARPRYLAGR